MTMPVSMRDACPECGSPQFKKNGYLHTTWHLPRDRREYSMAHGFHGRPLCGSARAFAGTARYCLPLYPHWVLGGGDRRVVELRAEENEPTLGLDRYG